MTAKRSQRLAIFKEATREELDNYWETKRPTTRGECREGPRPCPWVGCVHHLYLDVNPEDGQISYNFPDREPHELRHSCSLDVADKGGITLEEIAEIGNVTRERIRQIETAAISQLRKDPSVRNLEEQDERILKNRLLAQK